MKLFGFDLFNFNKKNGEATVGFARNTVKESKILPDFYRMSGRGFLGITQESDLMTYVVTDPIEAEHAAKEMKKRAKASKKTKKADEEILITPKGVYELKMLNEEGFKIKVDPEYVDAQITSFEDRVKLIRQSEYDMENGAIEVASMLIRLTNRKKYEEFKDYFEKFPYTTSEKINAVLHSQKHLRMGSSDTFVADFPQEAIDVMKEYTEQVFKLCAKKPLFYVMAEKKDFQRTENRKDPILFAQSPFGHVWQILGAWDKEMQLLSDL